MRKCLGFFLLGFPVLALAQSPAGFLRAARQAEVSLSLEAGLSRAAVTAQSVVLPRMVSVPSFLLKPTPDFAAIPSFKSQAGLTAWQRKAQAQHYWHTLVHFEQLKKEIQPLLLYQSLPSESRSLTTQEKRQWLDRLFPLHEQLLQLYTQVPQDVPLQYALEYVRYGIVKVDPALSAGWCKPLSSQEVPFDPKSFFLYPGEVSLPDPSIQLDEKQIVIINDDLSLLEHFEHLSHIGVLFPGAALHTEGNVMQFFLRMQYANRVPDIIFTDIQLGESNGYVVAQELRRRGYKGGIIALTSYTETEEYALRLKASGFDGLVSLDDRYYGKIPFFQRLTQAAQVYLQNHPTQ